MKSKRSLYNLFNLRFVGVINLFLTSMLFGCGGIAPSSPRTIKGKIVAEGNADKSHVIVLIHGLESPGDLNLMRQKLAQDFPNIIVAELNRTDSGTSPIIKQTEDAFEELKHLNLTDKELILLGDSQGGLVAWELYNSYKDQLKVKLLITNHTPWEGAPIATLTEKIMENIQSRLTSLFPINGSGNPSLSLESLFDRHVTIGHGVTDLRPDSDYLQGVKLNLIHAEIPILAIGGKIDAISGMSVLIGLDPEAIKLQIQITGADLNSVYSMLHTLSEEIIGHQENDAFVPLDSQIAKNIPTNSQFKREIINGYHHFASIMEDPVYPLIVKTIQEVL